MTDQAVTAQSSTLRGIEETTLVVPLADLPQGRVRQLMLGRRPILVFRDGDTVSAVAGRCTHQGAELIDGRVEGGTIRCPWHGAVFDVRTGARMNPPKCRDLRSYPVRIDAGEVTIGGSREVPA